MKALIISLFFQKDETFKLFCATIGEKLGDEVMKEIVMATNNAGKVKEMQALFDELGIKVLALKDVFKEPIDIEENGATFEENAIIKAEAICQMIGQVVIADDSGIEIDAMDKKPGVESARFLGHDTSYEYKNNYILDLLKGNENRSARYVCAMAIAFPNRDTVVFRETMEGEIADAPKGENGFGYDPIFYFPPTKKTGAEMDLAEKNLYSHRAKATRHVLEVIKEMKDNG